MLLNSRWQFGNILSLSRNDRISSFYWIRRSKHHFLPIFSNLYCYFLFLVFSRKRYLLVSLHLSRLRGKPIPHPVFLYLWFSKYHVVHVPPYFWHTWCIFSKQDSRGNLVLELVPVSRSAFRQRFLMQMSVGSSQVIPFLLMQNSLNWHFLAWHTPTLSQPSPAQARNPKEISQVANQGWLFFVWRQLLDDFTSALCTWSCSTWFLALCSIW